MAPPPSAAFSSLTYRYSGLGLPFGAQFTIGGTTPVGDLGDVLDAIAESAGEIAACSCGTVSITEVLWKVGPGPTGPSTSIPVSVIGETGTAQAPPNVAALVRLTVEGLSGRFAGRFFIPALDETGVDSAGNLNSPYFDIIQAQVLAMYETLALVGFEPRVFSSTSSDARIVSNVATQTVVATQRRRLRR